MAELSTLAEMIQSAESKTDTFSDIIEKIEYAQPEIKLLWTEIYRNALDDRARANMLYVDLYKSVCGDKEGHLNFGVLMTKYIERLNKANDQLLKLSEQVEKMMEMDENVDASSLYDDIANTAKAKK